MTQARFLQPVPRFHRARRGLVAGCTVFAMILSMSNSAVAADARTARMIEVAPNVSLRVIDIGPKNSLSPVVLIPGWGMTADIWSEQAKILSATRRVIAFDPRSQGRSTLVAEGITPEQRAEDLRALITRLELHNVTLMGWSQGVQDIAAYVLKFGTSQLAGAVLVDAPFSEGARSIAREPEKAAQMFALISLYNANPAEFAEGSFRNSFSKPMEPASRTRILSDILATPTAIGTAMIVSSRFGPDRTTATAKLNRPVLVIASAASPDFQTQRTLASALPCGSFESIEDAGHGVFIDQPQRFSDLVERFLTRGQFECPQPLPR